MQFRSLTALFISIVPAFAQADHTLGYDNTPLIPNSTWRVHDSSRPRPRVITPGAHVSTPAPSDAIVLFDGKDLSQWVTMLKGQPAEPKWKVENGYFEVVPKTGSVQTKEKFQDVQLHVEWSAPTEIRGKSQERGNSGILFMTRYEIQVLDSYENPTYADGQAGSIYGQWPPLVNAMRKPGEWNAYDIVFEAPRFTDGKLVKPGYATVFHNGVVLQNRQEILGDTPHARNGKYVDHGAEEPLGLQNHGAMVRYRNIWIRRLRGYDQP
jgi:hypothetical protein